MARETALNTKAHDEIATKHARRAMDIMMEFDPVNELRVGDVKYLARLVNEACHGAMLEMADSLDLED